MTTLQTALRLRKEQTDKRRRRERMSEFIKNTIALALFTAALFAAIEIPSWIHSRDCDGCDWFWCNNYNGK